nr:DEAD/DEAH box helicase [Bacillus sp. OxB-1]
MDLSKQLQIALAECEKLRRENEYLKQMIHTQLPCFVMEDSVQLVSNKSTVQEKVRLFRSLFHGRADVFAVRWESNNGKAGYAPACSNEWKPGICKKPHIKCSNCGNRNFTPLTDQVIYNHLSGLQIVGLYPLLEDGTCWFLCIDFDKKSWQDDVTSFISICKHTQIPFSIERSRSGDGAHVWIFFSQAVPANLARTLGKALLKCAAYKKGQAGLDSFDRLFPNQDSLSHTGGLGNLIALPLQRHARNLNNSVFVNESFQPFEDQWGYLSTIIKMEEQAISNAIHKLSYESPRDHGTSTPERITAILKNGVYFESGKLPTSLSNELIELASFSNPEFYRARAKRKSTHDLSSKIYCATQNDKNLILPRGCTREIQKLMDSHNISLDWSDERNDGDSIDVSFQGTLTPQQQDALDQLTEQDAGVLSAATGFGKTVIGAALIAARKVNTLIIVHRNQLIDQWLDQLSIFLDIPRKQIGQIGGGKQTATGNIDIATIQTLNSQGRINPIITQYGQVIVDECHHLSAFSFEQVMKNIRSKYIYGLTATPTRKDGLHPIITMQCGPILYKTDAKMQAQIRPFLHRLIRRDTTFKTKSETIQAIYNELMDDHQRNQLIFNDVLLALEEGRTPLVLTERIQHIKELESLFNGFVKNIVTLTGAVKKKEREQSLNKLRQLKDTEEVLVIATGKYIGEGFDFPRLDTLFLAMPISWKGVLTQYVGRLHRNYSEKQEVRVYDYVDQKVPMLQKMFEKRIKGFISMGYVDEEESGAEQMRLF